MKLSSKVNSYKNIKRPVKLIFNSSSQMLELVNELLDISKIESGKFAISSRTSELKELLERRVEFSSTMVKDKNIKLTAKISDDIPFKLEFDPMRIEQTLNNLLSNAVKHTDPGGQVEVQSFVHKKEDNEWSYVAAPPGSPARSNAGACPSVGSNSGR